MYATGGCCCAHLQGLETRLGSGIAALDYDVIPTRESGRFGHHAETVRVGLRARKAEKLFPCIACTAVAAPSARSLVFVFAGPSASMARPEFFFLGDRAIALEDGLALLP